MESHGGDHSKSKPKLEIVPEHQGQLRSNTNFGYKHQEISSDSTTATSSTNIAQTQTYDYAPNYPIQSKGKDRSSFVPGPERYSINHRLSTRSTASTRDSIASSILSRTLSTASTALSRYSSVRSTANSELVFSSPISPWSPHPSKETDGPPRSYWCTLCRAHFLSINEWKSHELGCQDAHLLCAAPDDVVVNTVRPSAQRSAWGCGFCAEYSLSLPEYLDHVGHHYGEGRGLNEWRHSSVIRGLLRQPGLENAWRALVSKKEPVSGAEGTFFWDPKVTGRSFDYTGIRAPRLQDLLECFAMGQMKPQAMAKAAYDLACVTAPDHAEDTVHELSMHIDVDSMAPGDISSSQRQSEPSQVTQTTPELEHNATSSSLPHVAPDKADIFEANVAGAVEEANSSDSEEIFVYDSNPPDARDRPQRFHLRTLSATSTASHIHDQGTNSEVFYDLPPAVPPRTSSQKYSSKIYVKVEGAQTPSPGHSGLASSGDGSTALRPQRRSALRRIDSERNLSAQRSTATLVSATAERREGRSLNMSEAMLPSNNQPHAMNSRPSPLPAIRETHSESRMDLLVVAEGAEASSVRSHDNSSILSARTGVSSVGYDDSASEVVYNDSASEPDLLLGVDGNSAESREWSRVYHHTVERVMEQLWSQYNHDWDQFIRSHPAGSSNNHSRGREQQASRRQVSGASRFTPGRSLQPGARYPFDADEDEDDLSRDPRAASSRHSPNGIKKFACPFRKHDPQTYNIHDHQVCTINAWPTIPRLKEHLYRRHYEIHCQRCKRIFTTNRDLEAHEMSLQGCAVMDIPPPCDITTTQEKQLKSRSGKNRPKHLTPEEKWREIYQLLFPNDDVIPSPYPALTEDLGPISPESRDSLSIQHHLLVRMPELFRQAAEEYLGRHIQGQDVLRMDDISHIIQESLNKAFREYEGSSSHSGSSNPMPSPMSWSFANNDAANVVSPSSPSTIPPWSNSEVPQLDANSYASRAAMQPATTWPSISSELSTVPLTSADLSWFSPTSTAPGVSSYEPYLPSTSGMSDPSFGTFLDPTTSHGDPYANQDTHMSGGALGEHAYFPMWGGEPYN